MRLGSVLAVMCLAACASDKLQQVPPAGVDLSGHWKLNEADSDDPQRLIQAQFDKSTATQSNPTQGGGGSSGGRGGRGGGRGAGSAMMPTGPSGPVMPSAAAMADSVRWPGKQLDVRQVAGVVAFTSGGASRVCQPMEGDKHHHHEPKPDGDGDRSGRDAPPRARDAPPPHCGWAEKTLIVQGGEPDEDRPPFEEHYSVSEDGQRLIEEVAFKGGRSSGFTLSRVWDRVAQ